VGLLAVGRRLSRPIRLSKPGSDFLRGSLGRFWPTKLHGPHAAPAISAGIGREQIGRDVKLSTADVASGADHRHIPHQKTVPLGKLTSAIGPNPRECLSCFRSIRSFRCKLHSR